ncbi:MAG: hypothetical protein WC359_05210 [Dehalococcoidia bacterium]|jgi:predicted permease
MTGELGNFVIVMGLPCLGALLIAFCSLPTDKWTIKHTFMLVGTSLIFISFILQAYQIIDKYPDKNEYIFGWWIVGLATVIMAIIGQIIRIRYGKSWFQ